tara:strand:+ start:2300 stop:2761 length:462 start_codon:yes stop_codon:yes gene_type:complete
MIEFTQPTEELIRIIADDMRVQDIEEVWASHHHMPIESLMGGWEVSDYSTVVLADGEPICMFGLVKMDLLSGSGVVWLLGCNRALKYKRAFLQVSGPVVDEMLTICPRLCNMVHAKNTISIRWLKWLGFTIEEPVPHGPDGELFHKFFIERCD